MGNCQQDVLSRSSNRKLKSLITFQYQAFNIQSEKINP